MTEPSMTQTPTGAPRQKLSGIGATEDQVDLRATVPQRIDSRGTKVEDEAGNGQIDSGGG